MKAWIIRLLKVVVVCVGSVGLALTYANWPASQVPEGAVADEVLVLKGERRLMLMKKGEVLARYPITMGADPVGHKQRQGDERTPEGHYVLDWRNPNSVAHLSIHISYPNAEDRARAASEGVDPGGDIMVHGIANGLGLMGRFHRLFGWTDGCIAVTNSEMDEIWRAVRNGTPIEIRR